MQALIVFSACLAVASAQLGFGYFGQPLAVAHGYAGYAGIASTPVSSQYHAQDELGQYAYGYNAGTSAKSESRTADGITRGAYSYVDANGIVQHAQYVSDPVNGFRVAATNLPVGPAGDAEVVAAPVAVPLAASPFAAAPLAAASFAAAPFGFAAPAAGPVHFAALPVAPQDTPEVQIAKIQHAQAHADAAARAAFFV